MVPPVLFLKNAQLTFGGSPLLAGADIVVEAGSRIGLVGRNGSGKSTMMKILSGQIEMDKGERFLQPGTTIRYLHQEPDFSNFRTVISYVMAGLEEGDDPYRAQYLLNSLQLEENQDPKLLSGGEARRAALARTLAPSPDVLLLDEPTNHLDLPTIEWLESELSNTKSAVVLISHDRRLLENLTRTIVWVDRGMCREMKKGFAFFEEWRDQVLEQEVVDKHKLDRKIVREEHWMTHGVTGRRKRNMRRVKELADLKQQRREAQSATGSVVISNAETDQSGKLVAKLDKVSKSFGDRPIVKNLSLILSRGDRIGVVGPNGSGKTTLIKLITGNLQPDIGHLKVGVNVDMLVLDQKRDTLKPDWTLKEAMTDGAGDMVSIGQTTKHVMAYMQDFLFTPEQANTPIHALSGGERGRLMLARGLRNPSNLLVLDEPTNDLDLETLDLLQEFISEYTGTVILVSHDRDFIDRTCTSVVTSHGDGKWVEYAGGYTDMLSQRGDDTVVKTPKQQKSKSPVDHRDNNTSEPSERKLSFKQKHALETLPVEIEKLNFEIGKLQTALMEPDLFQNEPKKFAKYSEALTTREKALENKEEEWLELELLREQLNA